MTISDQISYTRTALRCAKPHSRRHVASIDRNAVRLVLIDAYRPWTGAFTRMVKAIEDAELVPTVLEPTREFAAMLKRRGWRGKRMGHNHETFETIWKSK